MARTEIYSAAFVEIGFAKALLLEARLELEPALSQSPRHAKVISALSVALSAVEAARGALGSALEGVSAALGRFVHEANAPAVGVASCNLSELVEAIWLTDRALCAVKGAIAVSLFRAQSPLACQALEELNAAVALLDGTRQFVAISVLASA